MPLTTPTLQTARLRLRPFADTDAEALFAIHSSAHVLRYWDSPPWSEPARADRFLDACRSMAEDGIGARVAVERAADGAFLGWCSLTRWDAVHRTAALGYVLDAPAWGHGYATEAAAALLRWAFDTLDLNRVQAETDTRNAASARVLEKVGFVREGTLREDCVVSGEVSDSWVFGLLRRDRERASLPSLARFAAGEQITVREVLHDAEWASWREEVVSDDAVLATVQADGTPLAFPPHPVPHPWGHLAAWQGTSVLKLRREGDWYSVWKFFDDTGFRSWYVNFETPYRRTADGVEVNDLQLDVVIPPEGGWRWKDVEDLGPALESGRISQAELRGVLAAATDVAALLERDERWWAPWDRWSPRRRTPEPDARS